MRSASFNMPFWFYRAISTQEKPRKPRLLRRCLVYPVARLPRHCERRWVFITTWRLFRRKRNQRSVVCRPFFPPFCFFTMYVWVFIFERWLFAQYVCEVPVWDLWVSYICTQACLCLCRCMIVLFTMSYSKNRVMPFLFYKVYV